MVDETVSQPSSPPCDVKRGTKVATMHNTDTPVRRSFSKGARMLVTTAAVAGLVATSAVYPGAGAQAAPLSVEGIDSAPAYLVIAGDVVDDKLVGPSIDGKMNAKFWEELAGNLKVGKDSSAREFADAFDGMDGAYAGGMIKRLVEETNVMPTVELTGGHEDVEEGWWLIAPKDREPSLVLVGEEGLKVTVKPAYPVVEKEVFEDSTDTWGEIADACVSQEVPYKLTGTVSAAIASYSSYPYTFVDAHDEALAPDTASVRAFVEHVSGSRTEIPAKGFHAEDASGKLKVSFDDLKEWDVVGDDKIVVEYNAHLIAGAFETGVEHAAMNKVHIEFPTDPSDPTGSLAESEEDDANLCTYSVKLTKVDDKTRDKLDSATFAIRDAETQQVLTRDGRWLQSYTDECAFSTENGELTFSGLDEGTYQIVEAAAPKGYVLPETGITLTVESQLDEGRLTVSADGDMTEVTYVDAVAGDAGATIGNVKDTSKDGKDKKDNGDKGPGGNGNGGTPGAESNPFSRVTSFTKPAKTGDISIVLPAAVLVLAAAAGGLALVASRKRKGDEEQ